MLGHVGKNEPPNEGLGGLPGELSLAANETEAIQLILCASSKEFEGMYLAPFGYCTALEGPVGHVITSDQISCGLVRDVKNSVDPSRPNWPDWISPGGVFSLKPGEIKRLWITVRTRPDQPPGLYQGQIRLTVNSVTREDFIDVPLRVRVWDFSLPTRMRMNTVLSWSVDHDLLLSHHFSPGGGPGSGAVTEPRYLLKPDGSIDIDFEEYDRVMGECRKKGLTAFGLPLSGGDAGGLKPTRMRKTFIDPLTGKGQVLSLWPGDGPLAEERLIRFIRIFTDHLREQGWLEDAYFYLWDEPKKAQYEPDLICLGKIIRRACPGLRILTVFYRSPLKLNPAFDDVVDIYVIIADHWMFDGPARQKIVDMQRQGKTVWWYTCGDRYPIPGFMTIGYPAIISRMQFWMNWHYKIPGSLYWGSHVFGSIPDAPGLDGKGDGMFIYPDHSPSVRLEMIRDGIEDYEYLAILDKLTEGLTNHLARELLEISPLLARGFINYNINPDAWMTRRRQIAEAIEKIIDEQRHLGEEN